MSFDHPRVWVGVFVIKNGKILLWKRKSKHGFGEWAPPGGHLELWETPEECAKREVFEETGIVLENIILGPYTNNFFRDTGKHYITLFAVAECPEDAEPVNTEPEKCEWWQWHDWDNFPEPHFPAIQSLKSVGFNPVHYYD